MSDMEKMRSELLKDPEFREYYQEMQPLADISKAIIDARLKKGLTQKELSNLCGVPQANISRLEACDGNPSIKTLNRIARSLNMRLEIKLIPNEEESTD